MIPRGSRRVPGIKKKARQYDGVNQAVRAASPKEEERYHKVATKRCPWYREMIPGGSRSTPGIKKEQDNVMGVNRIVRDASPKKEKAGLQQSRTKRKGLSLIEEANRQDSSRVA